MKTLNMLRSTAVALMSLSVIIACDNRGVTAMKARMYTPEERAQARAQIGSHRGSTTDAPKGSTVTRPPQPGAPAATPAPKADSTDPKINPKDGPEAKNFFEPIDATNQNAVIELAKLKKIVEDQLGQVNEAAKSRVLGLTVSNKSTANASIVDIDAVVFFRGREQTLNLSNIKIEVAAKDQVHGTSGVTVKNRTAANVDEQAQKPITTDELLVASVCLTEGPVCKHAYLIMQFGREDKSVDAAVFDLDQNMVIQNSNIGMPVTTFNDALNAGLTGHTRTRAERLERLCHLRPTSPKCVAYKAETAAAQATIATVPSTPSPTSTQPVSFQRAQDSGAKPNTKPMSFLTPGNPWAVSPSAPAANQSKPAAANSNQVSKANAIRAFPQPTEVKTIAPNGAAVNVTSPTTTSTASAPTATTKATSAPAASAAPKSSTSSAQIAALKAAGVKAFPQPTAVKTLAPSDDAWVHKMDPNQSMNRARDGKESDLSSPAAAAPASTPATTPAKAATKTSTTSSSVAKQAPATTTSGTADPVPWNWKLYNWFINN